jgi:hypothetical protein
VRLAADRRSARTAIAELEDLGPVLVGEFPDGAGPWPENHVAF